MLFSELNYSKKLSVFKIVLLYMECDYFCNHSTDSRSNEKLFSFFFQIDRKYRQVPISLTKNVIPPLSTCIHTKYQSRQCILKFMSVKVSSVKCTAEVPYIFKIYILEWYIYYIFTHIHIFLFLFKIIYILEWSS